MKISNKLAAAKPIIKYLLLSLLALWVALFIWDLRFLFSIGKLEKQNPKTTAFIEGRISELQREGKKANIARRFVSFGNISSSLKRAVLVAEDFNFYDHGGLDWGELGEAAKRNWREKRWARGGSTITQQLAKNLFLSSSRSLGRKAAEAILALALERKLSKVRIFELYLNYIEWGDGVFGCEAAARAHFKTGCASLSPEQSIRLASIIINPRKYSVYSTTKRIRCRQDMLARRMNRAGYLSSDQYNGMNFGCR